MFNFEKLDVWHRAIAFADGAYSFSRTFPDDVRFGLTSQMRRAADSMSSNIAEGTSRSSKIDFARFVEIATSSVFEVVSQAYLARKRASLSKVDYQRIYPAAEEQSHMLSGLRRSLIAD